MYGTQLKYDGSFKNEMSIRSSKAAADKADCAYVMTRVTDKLWNSLVPDLRKAARERIIDPSILEDSTNRPTHILDVYKMRRGRYKNVRIWSYIHLGTGQRKDLFITTADNQPFNISIDIFSSASEVPINKWREELINNAGN